VGLTVQVFSSASEFLSRHPVDVTCCLVLDVRLPGLSGLDLQHELQGTGTEIPIIFMSGYGDIPMTVRAMKAGAIEFLTKPFREQDLLDAIRQALDRATAARTRRGELAAVRKRFASLTSREREVMDALLKGMLNKQVAAELGITEITVKVHRRQKMGASSLVELAHNVANLHTADGQNRETYT
jgi:FixJ family two-component response regulator